MRRETPAVVVLGHGSRSPAAQEVLERVAGLLALQTGWTVAHASLEFNRPNLADAVADLYARGFRRVYVAPYLLYSGNHVARDIPEQLEGLLAEHPELIVQVTDPLGLDLRLVSVLETRIRAAQGEVGAVPASSVSAPSAIEGKSFDIIEQLLPDLPVSAAERSVIVRIIHATGDPSLASQLVFSPGAVERGIRALVSETPVICDVNMVRVGLAPSLRRLGVDVRCLVEDPRAVTLAARTGITRSVAAMRVAAESMEGAIVAIGNAPTALLEVVRMNREDGVRPALVVGVPVGFVAAAESKEALLGSALTHITLPGLRGGTPIAVAAVNALARLAVADPSIFAGSPVAAPGS
ncbi:MAG: precorrin-8X methylmutase [Thermoleophilia bacterium]|nr:precorrin-8X methylmutase [Thermoleophilia bacterium]